MQYLDLRDSPIAHQLRHSQCRATSFSAGKALAALTATCGGPLFTYLALFWAPLSLENEGLTPIKTSLAPELARLSFCGFCCMCFALLVI